MVSWILLEEVVLSGKCAAAADPAGDLDGVGEAGGGEEADGGGFAGLAEVPRFVGKFVGEAVAAFAEGLVGELDRVVSGFGDFAEHGEVAPAVAAAGRDARGGFFPAEGAMDGEGFQGLKVLKC